MLEKIIKRGKQEICYSTKKVLKDTPKLHSILWETTLNCNAKCKHCGSNAGEKCYKDELKTEEIKKAFKDIAEKYNSNEIVITATGGEPLLRKDLFEVMEYAKSIGFKCGMTTNGILFNEKIIEKMKEIEYDSVSISIDGLEENHDSFRGVPGSYKKIMSNIKLLQKYNFLKSIQITTVVNKKNISELETMYNVLKDMNIQSWRIINIEPIGRANDNKELMLEKDDYKYLFEFIANKRKNSNFIVTYGCGHFLGNDIELNVRDYPFFCMAGMTTCSILYNGDIYPCTSIERRKELIEGNVKKDNISKVWENGFKFERDLEKFKEAKTCRECKDWKYCLGDSLHSWDFENGEPRLCLNKLLNE